MGMMLHMGMGDTATTSAVTTESNPWDRTFSNGVDISLKQITGTFSNKSGFGPFGNVLPFLHVATVDTNLPMKIGLMLPYAAIAAAIYILAKK